MRSITDDYPGKTIMMHQNRFLQYSLQSHVWWRRIVAICCTSILYATVVSAQSTFSGLFGWPETKPDLSMYATVEQCLGVTGALRLAAAHRAPRQDTISMNAGDSVNALPPDVVAAAQRCSAKFSVRDLLSRNPLHLNEMINAYLLFWMANRDHDARELSQAWLTSIAPEQDTLRAKVLEAMTKITLRNRPVRLADAWSLIESIDMKKFWGSRMSLAERLMSEGIRIGDTVRAEQAALWLTRTPELVGPEVTQTDEWGDQTFGAGYLVFAAQQYLRRNELLDSLRRSTSAYAALLAQMRKQAVLPGDVERRIAPALEGEYWFPARPSQPLPQRGIISVVLTTGINECRNCLGQVAMIQRLHARFPDVQFTLLTRTRGFHGFVIEPPSPEQEARLIDSVYRKIHQLPATLVVFKTPFWKLEDPDRRRINEGGPNEDAFPTLSVQNSERLYLIDRKGEILFMGSWDTSSEAQVGKMVDALLHQPQ